MVCEWLFVCVVWYCICGYVCSCLFGVWLYVCCVCGTYVYNVCGVCVCMVVCGMCVVAYVVCVCVCVCVVLWLFMCVVCVYVCLCCMSVNQRITPRVLMLSFLHIGSRDEVVRGQVVEVWSFLSGSGLLNLKSVSHKCMLPPQLSPGTVEPSRSPAQV